MNARLEAAARALAEELYAEDLDAFGANSIQRAYYIQTAERVLAAADAHDTTERAWRDPHLPGEPIYRLKAGSDDVAAANGLIHVERRLGPWVSVTEGNDQ